MRIVELPGLSAKCHDDTVTLETAIGAAQTTYDNMNADCIQHCFNTIPLACNADCSQGISAYATACTRLGGYISLFDVSIEWSDGSFMNVRINQA